MSLILPLVAGLVVAPLLGGRLIELGSIRLRGVLVFYVAIVLQIAAFPISRLPWRTPDRVAVPLWLVSYGLFALALVLNARLPGVPLIAAGLVCNVSAIVANGGHMPALPSALRAAGLHFSVSRNSARLAHPHLAWLVDRWAAPHWVPWGNVFSVGDVLIMAGGLAFALLATGAFRRRPLLRLRRPAATSAS